MAYEFTNDLAEAERRLGEAMTIPGWPISPEYTDLIDAECTASNIRIIAIGLSGPLRAEDLLRATNAKIKAGRPDIGNRQIDLVCARGDVLDIRARTRRTKVGIVFGRHALAEVERECPQAMAQQLRRLDRAAQYGWLIGVVEEDHLRAEVQRLASTFVCSLSFDGVPGQPPATYLQIEGPTNHEHWINDPKVAQQHRDTYDRLAKMAVSL